MKIFISYSRTEGEFVKALKDYLTRSDETIKVWYDKDLTGGEAWWKRIVQVINHCDVFIFVLSQRAVQAKYCLKELERALEFNKKIVPILFQEDTPLPPELKAIQYINMLRGINDPQALAELNAALRTSIPPAPTAPPPSSRFKAKTIKNSTVLNDINNSHITIHPGDKE